MLSRPSCHGCPVAVLPEHVGGAGERPRQRRCGLSALTSHVLGRIMVAAGQAPVQKARGCSLQAAAGSTGRLRKVSPTSATRWCWTGSAWRTRYGRWQPLSCTWLAKLSRTAPPHLIAALQGPGGAAWNEGVTDACALLRRLLPGKLGSLPEPTADMLVFVFECSMIYDIINSAAYSIV